MPDNILLADWTGPYGGVPPWDQVKPTQFPEALQFAIEEQRREIAAIADNPEAPTFDNTIVALEKAGQRLGRVETIYGVYDQQFVDAGIPGAPTRNGIPSCRRASDEITLNPKLFQRIKARLRHAAEARPRRQADCAWSTRTYDSFVRNGANLEPAQKAAAGDDQPAARHARSAVQRQGARRRGHIYRRDRGGAEGRSAGREGGRRRRPRRSAICRPAPMPSSTPARRSIRC